MEFFDTIEKRKSIRKYRNEPLPDGVLEKILTAGRLANSARNRQEWAFIAVTDTETKERLVPACRNQDFVAQASVVIVGCAIGEYEMRCGQPADVIDTAIALDHMQLAATALGLGTCWLGSFYQNRVTEILYIPDKVSIIGILTVGIPDESGREKSRKSLDEIVYYNKWGGK